MAKSPELTRPQDDVSVFRVVERQSLSAIHSIEVSLLFSEAELGHISDHNKGIEVAYF